MSMADLAAANANPTSDTNEPSAKANAPNALLRFSERFDHDTMSYFDMDTEHDHEIQDFWQGHVLPGVIRCYIRREGRDEANSVLMINMIIHREAHQPGFLRKISDLVPEHLKDFMRITIRLNPSPEELPALEAFTAALMAVSSEKEASAIRN